MPNAAETVEAPYTAAERLTFLPQPAKADNRRVLRRYSDSMRTLQQNGYQVRRRPSNWNISSKFLSDLGGAIPPNLLGFAGMEQAEADLEGDPAEEAFDNLLTVANTASRSRYLEECRKHGIKPHTARFPLALPAFFIEFLTEPGDLVCDPFAGSNTTGAAAASANRHWLSCELDSVGPFAGSYVRASAFWFEDATLQPGFKRLPKPNWESLGRNVGGSTGSADRN